ncbi:P protein-like isoform X2 [Phlebotomus argentipes]|uniref:P protein-like isoform X2 n=1 Tax=Phlebotomus argentipes TaxID=94469 RepID=UPI0028937E7F|nr:P protein-like isoform X2 [Phlebotomus argentipes]
MSTKDASKESKPKRRSFVRKASKKYHFPEPSDVTEGSLQVWAGLPPKIRQDPSLASFQMEHNRLHGGDSHEEQLCGTSEDSHPEEIALAGHEDDQESSDHSESFITIKVPASQDTHKPDELEISTHPNPSHHSPDSHHTPESHHSPHNLPHNAHFYLHHDDHKEDPRRKYLKTGFLIVCWLTFAILLVLKKEKILTTKTLSVPYNDFKGYEIRPMPENHVRLTLEGAFLPNEYTNETVEYLTVALQLVTFGLDTNDTISVGEAQLLENIGDVWRIPLVNTSSLDKAPIIMKKHQFTVDPDHIAYDNPDLGVRINMWTTKLSEDFAVKLTYDVKPMNEEVGVIYAAIIMILLYVLIIWEIVHRTFATLIMSTLAVAILAGLDDRPQFVEIIQWLDIETIMLLMSMMIFVAVLTETGVFDLIAVYTFKCTGGRIWPLIHGLCAITVLVSSFLDNVTTLLLLAPISIKLCEVVELNPVPILMAIIVHANIGGTLTPIGDPPNVLITTNHYIAKHGVTFLTFTIHMAVGVIIVSIQTMIQLRIKYRKLSDLRLKIPSQIQDLRREIAVWKRAAASLSSYSKDADLVRETLQKKVKILQHQLKKKSTSCGVETAVYKSTMDELQKTYGIKNKSLLIRTGIALLFTIALFFIQSVPEFQRLTLAWSALLGMMLLLVLTSRDDPEAFEVVVARIDWAVLLFFAAMSCIIEAVSKLGFIHWIGKQTEAVIMSCSEDSRLAVAIILILWVTAITSSFVDSIPVTTMMIRVVVSLAENPALGLPLQPLVWALAFGTCLGANGTLVGASGNICAAGIAEHHGYKISFIDYFKFGFPLMLGSVVVTTGYLMVSHVLFTWH